MFALALAVEDSLGSRRVVDSGFTTGDAAELAEALATLDAAGYITGSADYSSDFLGHAQADALTLLGALPGGVTTSSGHAVTTSSGHSVTVG